MLLEKVYIRVCLILLSGYNMTDIDIIGASCEFSRKKGFDNSEKDDSDEEVSLTIEHED